METPQTAASIAKRIREADSNEFAVLERSFAADTRKTVRNALEHARKRLDAEKQEMERSLQMYRFQDELACGKAVLGLDEVGRGPLAGPLAVAGVVLPDQPYIVGLNDSKQLSAQRREELSLEIREKALAWTIQYIEASDIDEMGMSASLRTAFSRAIAEIEAQGVCIDVILIDGIPLHLDKREINVIKGDGKCASIAAASIIAKVARDALMVEYDKRFPEYGFASNKGYGSSAHQQAIRNHGLSPIHRASFCTAFTQESLF